MTPKQLQQILRISKARLKLEESRLAALSAKIAAAEEAIGVARRAAQGAGDVDAAAAAEKYYQASLKRLRDAAMEKSALGAERTAQAEKVKGELKRKLSVERAMKR